MLKKTGKSPQNKEQIKLPQINNGSKSVTHAKSNQDEQIDPLKQWKLDQKSLYYQKDQLSNRLKLMREQQSETLQKIESVQNKAYSVYLTKVAKDQLKLMMEERSKKRLQELAELKQKYQQLKVDPKKKEKDRIINLMSFNNRFSQEYKLFQEKAKENNLKEQELLEKKEKKRKVQESELEAKKRNEQYQKDKIQKLLEKKKKDQEKKENEAKSIKQEAEKLLNIEKQLEQNVNKLKK